MILLYFIDKKLSACPLSVNKIHLSGWCFQCLMETLRFQEIRGQKEWELKGSRQLRGGALGQLDREWEKKGQLCPEVSWIHCMQSEQWRTDKKNDLNKNSSAYAICKSFHKGRGPEWEEPTQRVMSWLSLFVHGPFICTFPADKSQERALVEGHLYWRWGLLHSTPFLTGLTHKPSDNIMTREYSYMERYENVWTYSCGFDYVLMKVFTWCHFEY